jgi:uncharacterized protein YeaO (DUF488 family)
MSYKRGEKGWAEFKLSFVRELQSNLDSVEAITSLYKVSRDRNVTLLCYEKSGVPCHRHLVRDLIEQPDLLSNFLEAKDADDHEGRGMKHLISD